MSTALAFTVRKLGENRANIHLRCKGLTVAVGERTLIDTLDLNLAGGELIEVSGANGSGKSSLLNVLAGKGAGKHGGIIWSEPKSFQGTPCIFYLPQYPILFPGMTVIENIALISGRTVAEALSELKYSDKHAVVPAILTALPPLQRPSGDLSTGQQRLLLFISAELSPARIFLLDEPWAGLHHALQRACKSRARTWAKDGRLVVIASPEAHETSCEGDA